MSISILKTPASAEQTIVFSGRGNNEGQAEKSALLSYSNWQHIQQRAAREINELAKTYSYKKNNDVNYKCELSINYILINIEAQKNKFSFFWLIYKYLRTIMPKRFYSKNNLK